MKAHTILASLLLFAVPALAADTVVMGATMGRPAGQTFNPGQVLKPSELCRKAVRSYKSIPMSEEYQKGLSPKKVDALENALDECSIGFSNDFRKYFLNDYWVGMSAMHTDGRVEALDNLLSVYGKPVTQQLMNQTFGKNKATRLTVVKFNWMPDLKKLFGN